jgi:hypothetical protein
MLFQWQICAVIASQPCTQGGVAISGQKRLTNFRRIFLNKINLVNRRYFIFFVFLSYQRLPRR